MALAVVLVGVRVGCLRELPVALAVAVMGIRSVWCLREAVPPY